MTKRYYTFTISHLSFLKFHVLLLKIREKKLQ